MLAVGGAVGGLVAASLGAEAALVIDSASFVLSALLITWVGVSAPKISQHATVSGWRDFVDGLVYVRQNPAMGWIATVKGLGQTGSVDVISAVLAARVFPVGAEGGGAFALMLMAFGVGTVIGPIVGNRFQDGSARKLDEAILGGFGLIVLGWLVVGLSPTLELVLVGWVLRGFGGSINWTYSDILIQMKTPSQFLGRVFAFNLAIFTLLMSVSTWASGELLDRFQMDPRTLSLWLSAASLLPVALWAWKLRQPVSAPSPELSQD